MVPEASLEKTDAESRPEGRGLVRGQANEARWFERRRSAGRERSSRASLRSRELADQHRRRSSPASPRASTDRENRPGELHLCLRGECLLVVERERTPPAGVAMSSNCRPGPITSRRRGRRAPARSLAAGSRASEDIVDPVSEVGGPPTASTRGSREIAEPARRHTPTSAGRRRLSYRGRLDAAS